MPSGGVVNALAPALLDWYFSGWTGSSSTAEAMLSFTGISRDSALVANYINRRQEPCRDTPPANATSIDQEVTVSYTTAGGWMTPPVCAWSCNPGAILATYTTSLPGNFVGDWVYWNTARTTLNAGTPYIFTSFLTTAFTQRVTGGSAGDTAAGYPGGGGYAAEVTSGDIVAWSLWFPHDWDFDFRIQLRNAACP